MSEDQPVPVAVRFVTCGSCKFQYNDEKMRYCYACHSDICENCWWQHVVGSFLVGIVRFFFHP